MATENTSSGSSSESEFEETEKLSEEEEEHKNVKKISDYEKQRLSRIVENNARMEALGLHKMASSSASSVQKTAKNRKLSQRKGKSKAVDNDDEDYRPNNDDDDQDDDEFDEKDDEDEEFLSNASSKSRKNKVKSRVLKPKKNALSGKHFGSADYIDDENDELMQAIALSLQDSAKAVTLKERKEKDNYNIQEDSGRRKRKKPLSNRPQMTEDELVLYFFQFDEQGRGYLTVRDLQRLATAHDFTWTDKELDEMIHYFDSDGDGRLSLDDFGKIAGRCNMIQRSEKS